VGLGVIWVLSNVGFGPDDDPSPQADDKDVDDTSL